MSTFLTYTVKVWGTISLIEESYSEECLFILITSSPSDSEELIECLVYSTLPLEGMATQKVVVSRL